MTSSGHEYSAVEAPAWASALGAVAVLIAVLAAAVHGNEWMKHYVVVPMVGAGQALPEPDCAEDELEEEGLSIDECWQMARSVQDLNVSRPHWYRGVHMSLSALGLLAALVSLFAGVALVDYRPWAPSLALASFAGFALIDLAIFAAASLTGPIMRAMYLWDFMVWLFVHLSLAVAIVALRPGSGDRAPRAGA